MTSTSNNPVDQSLSSFLSTNVSGIAGGGKMGELIRAFEWDKTNLGPLTAWPQSLKTAVNLVLQSPVPLVMLWGTEGIMLYNDAYSLFAASRHPFLLGSKVVEGWPEVADFNRNVMEKCLRGETLSYKNQKLTLSRNHIPEDVWLDLNYSSILDESGTPAGVLAIVVERTRQVRAEQSLKESEARFRSMAESSEMLISMANEYFQSIYFNKAWTQLTGRPVEALLDLGWADLLHPQDREVFLNTYRQALEKKESFDGEFRILNAAGEYRWLFVKVPARFRPEGSFAGYISSAIDITERKQAEEEKQKLAAIIQESSDFIGLATPAGSILYLNPAAMRILGWDRFEGKQIIDCIYPGDRDYVEAVLLPQLRTDGSFSLEYRFWNVQRNEPVWLQWKGITVRDPQTGEVIALATMSPDITARRREEAEKLFQNKLMSMIAYAQSLFFSNQNIYDMFEEPLQQLLDLTQSEYGFIGEILHTAENRPYLKCCFINNISWDEETRQLWESYRRTGFEFHKLDNLFGKVITTGETVISNDTAHDPHRSKEGRPQGHPPLNTFLGIPFYKNEKLVGMVGIANKPDGYDMALVEKLQPFMDACANIITAYRNRLEKEQLTNELSISEGRFRAAVSAVQGIPWTNNAQGQMEGEQPAWSALTGQFYEEYKGYGWSQAVHPEDRQATIDAWHQALQEHKAFLFEHRVRRLDGVWRRYSVRAIPIFETNGAIREWVGVHTDITEQYEAEEALKESQERFQAIANDSPMLIFLVGEDTKVNFWNKAYLEYTGLSYEEALGQNWQGIAHPDDFFATLQVYNAAFEAHQPYTVECRFKNKAGEYRWILWKGAPRYLPNGQFVGYMGTGLDIHDRKMVEAELASYANRLERSNKELEQFATIASHDLQEPIRKIQVFSEMLASGASLEGNEYLFRINAAASRMRTLVDDLLMLSRVNRRGQAFKWVNLDEILQIVLDDMQVTIQEANATIQVASLTSVLGDESQIRQLFQNLIANAIKYHRDDVAPVVSISGKRKANDYEISVQDNGIGIIQEHYERIFEPFQRLHGVGKYPGTGMGLAICKKIVERHGGTIQLESEIEKGSNFIFTLRATKE